MSVRVFKPKSWKDEPDHTTPIDAAALKDLETRLSAYTDYKSGRVTRTVGLGTGVVPQVKFDFSVSDNQALPQEFLATQMLRLAVDSPCRMRWYDTRAHRDADLARPVAQDPVGDHGLLLEMVFTAGNLAYTLTPSVELYTLENGPSMPMTIDALAGNLPGNINLTYTGIPLE